MTTRACVQLCALGRTDTESGKETSVGSTSEILRQLYPEGIRPDQYDDLQILVRTLDKLKRIASRGPDGRDRGGENPWQDVAGYAVLALELAERRERERVPSVGAASSERSQALIQDDALADMGNEPVFAEILASHFSRCGQCDACATERIGCACDGSAGGSCFNCDFAIDRPPCPTVSDTCHGCKHVVGRYGAFYCTKTNRPSSASSVALDDGCKPDWCPGKETA